MLGFLAMALEGGATAMTLTEIISAITEIFTAIIGYVATVGTTITSTPLLLIMCLVPLSCIGVGLFKRLMNVQ